MIRNLGKLGLNGTDFAVLSIILSYWWDADTPPSPRVGGIAYMLDTSPRTVERTIKKLRKLRLIKQGPTYSTPTGLRRDFDLSSLVTKVSVLAENDLRHLAEVRRQREEKRRQAIAEELDDLDDFDDDVPY